VTVLHTSTPRRLGRGRFGLVLIWTVLALLMMAVVGVPTSSAKPKATITLTVLQTVATKAGQDLLDANFERQYPNIKIEATYATNAAINSQLLTEIAAGNAPDMFYTLPAASGLDSVWTLAAAGRLLDLTKNNPWAHRLPIPMRPKMSYHGKLYAWPTTYNIHGILYNASLMSQLGLKPPTTYAQTLALCHKIVAAGKIPFALGFPGGNEAIQMSQIFFNEFVYAVNPKWNAKRNKHQVSFATSPLWQQAFGAFLQMKDAGCFNPSPEGTTYNSALGMLANGQAVMEVASLALLGPLAALNTNIPWRLTSFPAVKASQTLVSGGTQALAGSATTKYPNEVRTFIAFAARPKQSYFQNKANLTVDVTSASKGIVPALASAVIPQFKAGRFVDSTPSTFPNPNLWFGVFAADLPGLFTGQLGVANILKAADYMWDNPTAISPP
jgi:raffinose/stachyose/melibiose transport system substrate-binding protein